MAIYRGTGSTGTGGESDFAQLAQDAEDAAAAALVSENNAELAETNAETAASQAESHAYLASLSEAQAASSATSASGSASTATTQATNAANSATAAATSASNASTSATNAANSATSASTSASTATTQATNAANSATAAASSASAASNSATNAASSASTATTQATNASNSASAAATSATNASNSATSASTSATNAAASAAAAAATVTSKVSKSGDVMTGSLEVPTEASLKATALTRASIRPSLLLDFANTKQLDPRITFSRASTGTYYDGKTVVKAEENLLPYSQEFDNSSWVKARATVTANATTSPDGTYTADKLIEDSTASNTHFIEQSPNFTSGNIYVFSVYAKSGERSQLRLRSVTTNVSTAEFDLSAGTVSNITGANSAAIVSAGNGWYRCSMNVTATASSAGNFDFQLMSGGTVTYTGDGTSGLYLWGAQLEQRSAATSYTPTTTAPITNYIPALQTAALNEARFDCDPVTGESKGLLIEEQRTNLITYSDQFDNAAWTKQNSTITANATIAPDGTLTADKLIENSGSAIHNVYRFITPASGAVTFSVYVKSAGRTQMQISSYEGAVPSNPVLTTFDLTAGTVVSNGGLTTSSSIVNVGNGWYRCTSSGISAGNSTSFFVNTAASGSTTTTGNGYSGLYIWGAQLEAGAFPTSYIPTVASQVTRSADAASMTGTNFSSWYRADEGTIYAESASPITSGGLAFLFYMDAGSGTPNSIYSDVSANLRRLVVFSGNAVQTDIGAGNLTANASSKYVAAFASNSFASSLNSSAVQVDLIGSIPANLSRMFIGSNAALNAPINGTIKRLAYYPKRLSNAELQGITS